MAIVRIIEPNVPPTETADWGRMLELIRALELRAGDSNVVDWPSLTIKKGAVFFLGGTVYQADADATISGTASSFVKLTPSSDGSVCTVSYVTSLTGVSWNSTYNGWYDADGNLYVFQAALPDRPHMARFVYSGTFVVPLGIDTIYISGCAAGGNGGAGHVGGGSGTGNNDSGGGGGGGSGGQQIHREAYSVTPGEAIPISIGAVGSNTSVGSLVTLSCGNSGSDAGYTGNASGGSAIASYNGVILSGGAGGDGGSGIINGSVGSLGTSGTAGSMSDLYKKGGSGGTYGPAGAYPSGGGGGGGGGGYSGFGYNGASTSASAGIGYSGGGGGAGGAGTERGGNGGGGGFGGGGGGGGGSGATVGAGAAGGSGGPALIIIEW